MLCYPIPNSSISNAHHETVAKNESESRTGITVKLFLSTAKEIKKKKKSEPFMPACNNQDQGKRFYSMQGRSSLREERHSFPYACLSKTFTRRISSVLKRRRLSPRFLLD